MRGPAADKAGLGQLYQAVYSQASAHICTQASTAGRSLVLALLQRQSAATGTAGDSGRHSERRSPVAGAAWRSAAAGVAGPSSPLHSLPRPLSMSGSLPAHAEAEPPSQHSLEGLLAAVGEASLLVPVPGPRSLPLLQLPRLCSSAGGRAAGGLMERLERQGGRQAERAVGRQGGGQAEGSVGEASVAAACGGSSRLRSKKCSIAASFRSHLICQLQHIMQHVPPLHAVRGVPHRAQRCSSPRPPPSPAILPLLLSDQVRLVAHAQQVRLRAGGREAAPMCCSTCNSCAVRRCSRQVGCSYAWLC